MTLIASYTPIKHPIIIGDLLLSRQSNEEIDISRLPAFNTPTYSNINSILPSKTKIYIAGLARKLVPITDHCVMAWTGHEIAAVSIYKDVKQLIDKYGIDFSRLKELLNQLEPNHFGSRIDLGFCLLFVNNNQMCIKGWSLKRFSKGVCGGSGADDFLAVEGSGIIRGGSDYEVNPIAAEVCQTLFVTGKLLGDQIRSGKGIESFYGGGFEMAVPYDGKMNFIPITYLFLSANISAENLIEITFHSILVFSYHADLLLVRRLVPCQPEPMQEIFVLSPLGKKISSSDAKLLDFSWPQTKFAYAYVHYPQTEQIIGLSQYGEEIKLIEGDNETLEIEISQNFKDMIYERALKI